VIFFASDLHGRPSRYERLWEAVLADRPRALLLGGDLLPHGGGREGGEFLTGFLAPGFARLRARLGDAYPSVGLILGNDDPRCHEESLLDGETTGLWTYLHGRSRALGRHRVYGYACIPPSPFGLKDWERYDVAATVPPGCLSPEEGRRSVAVDPAEVRYGTIAGDLERLCPPGDHAGDIFLFHAPPYGTALDRAALDGRRVDHAPLDLHVGSVAVRRFIETRQPLVTLHGHVHESARITGSWRERLGATWCLGAAHEGPELALVRFDPARPEDAVRELR
jgi:Icc-related predicted phosphoesterase